MKNIFNCVLDNIHKIEYDFLSVKKIGIAVSGGVDSMCLLGILYKYLLSSEHNLQIYILYVDHNLRDNSYLDGEFIKNYIDKLNVNIKHINRDRGKCINNIKFISCLWNHDQDNKSAIQSRAREARYNLITDKAKKLNIELICTAHHYNDVIETFIMKRKRINNIFGLSYNNIYYHNDVRIIRPMYNIYKRDILSYMQNSSLKWREDTSNASDKYERNIVRKYFDNLNHQKQIDIIEELENNQQKALKANKKLIDLIASYVEINKFGFALIDKKLFQINIDDNEGLQTQNQNQIQIQILNYVITIISGKKTIARYRNIQKLISLINVDDNFKVNLHYCYICTKPNLNNIYIYFDRKYIDYNKSDNDLYNRFKIYNNELRFKENQYKICYINDEQYKIIKNKIGLNSLKQIDKFYFKEILFTLPVMQKLDNIIYIPHIYDEFNIKSDMKLIFSPKFTSRFTHFL